jgi:hypothetical protein
MVRRSRLSNCAEAEDVKGRHTDRTETTDLTDRSLFWLFRYSAQRLKMSEPFVPPNPNEFDNATWTLALREWLAT